jgi:phosphatidylglycerol:prolipoprotein diacylglycerol transferase
MAFLPAALSFPSIDPFLFRFGSVGLSWYAFMYLLGFVLAYFILRRRFQKGFLRLKEKNQVGSLVTYCFYGLILGARLFYVFFYNPRYFLENPLEIPALWHGGMSFHGGLVGVILAMWWFGKRENAAFLNVADNVALCAPVGLFFGRIGNFINGELYGRTSDVPWAMVFPRGGPLPRHPSQLYEALGEGLLLALILWWVARRPRRDGTLSGLFVLLYAVFRFFIEFFREPDPQLGFILGPFSMGQVWCVAMLALAGFVLAVSRRGPSTPS